MTAPRAVMGRPTADEQARVDLVALRGDADLLLRHATPKAKRLALALEAIAADTHAAPLDRLLAQLAAGLVHDLMRFQRHVDGPTPEPSDAVAA